MNEESLVLTETHGRVGLVRLNRPKQLNALSDPLMDALGEALMAFERNDEIAVMVITGSEKAFAAGADITRMKDLTYSEAFSSNFISRNWEQVLRCRKPVIAAVSGYALGGGCELAMMCDTIVCGENAKFAQPEVKLGIPPGAGGSQRTPRAIGKAKAMDLCLTGRMMDAAEAERSGLVARVVAADKVVEEALAMASEMAAYSVTTLMQIKELVNQAYEAPLSAGLLLERRGFHAAFATQDQKEGMAAFVEKRPASFRGR
ncbi:MAG: enoyl-CoA hydratase [Betaproteobacteria bacterium]|nr:enoyl-CoA hydratase [Betaproteobacteria bacterium]